MFDRKSIRLRGYDYRKDGYYFVTIRVRKKKCLFGTIVDGMMYLNHAGKMVEDEWLLLTKRFPHISLDEYVIMPNHMHGIIVIGNPDTRASIKDAPTFTETLGKIIGAFKSITTNAY